MFLNLNAAASRVQSAMRGMSFAERWRRARLRDIVNYVAARAFAAFIIFWLVNEVLGHLSLLGF